MPEDIFGGTMRRVAAHFAGQDDGASDKIEIWGRRIGHALGATAFVALCCYLYFTYIR